jgi:cell division initiation protein
MKLAPMDIQKQKFTIKFRGYDEEEVHAFLSSIADQMEQLIKENDLLKKEVEHLKESLEEYIERENVLKNTLVSAQRASDQLRENAQKEAQILIKEAELKANKILESAQKQLMKLKEDLLQLRMKKNYFQENVLMQMEAIKQLINAQREEEKKDEKLSYMINAPKK